MRIYFVDSSALVKRYVAEVGTAWVQSLADPDARNHLIIARITQVEITGALARREREGSLDSEAVSRALDTLRYDLDTQYQVVELDPSVAGMAAQLARLHPLRAYDAVQLASAQQIYAAFAQDVDPPFTFLTADDRLLTVAGSVGLPADNPNRRS
ncbi:MAG: type II toxin-antitoxin system VapC family toxin [Anaerolineae bacterium]